MRAIANHQLPFIFAADPFRLSRDEILVRISALQAVGANLFIIASTDDEGYESVVPDLVDDLRATTGAKIVEHFRPTREAGFRKSPGSDFVLMTTVVNSSDDFYARCDRVESQNSVSQLSSEDRFRQGLILSSALVLGKDLKSKVYVGSDDVYEGEIDEAVTRHGARMQHADVIYLFSRMRRLEGRGCKVVRGAMGRNKPIIASGCVRNSADIEDLQAAGASQVVVGSLLESGDWRERLQDLLKVQAVSV